MSWIFFDVGSTLVDETLAYDHRAKEMLAGTGSMRKVRNKPMCHTKWIATTLILSLILSGCGGEKGSETTQKTLETSHVETTVKEEPRILEISVSENREDELVFSISAGDFIDSYNSFYRAEHTADYLPPLSRWQWETIEKGIHSEYETGLYRFSEDEMIYSVPVITVYTPSDSQRIQKITVNFDEHGYTDSFYRQFKEMCLHTLRVFFPDLSDARLAALYSQVISTGSSHSFSSDEWYGSGAVPYALYYRGGIGVYPYFAVGDWSRMCVIPVTEETLREFAVQGVALIEIE